MTFENLRVKYKKQVYETRLAMPETLAEAIELLDESVVFEHFVEGYRDASKRALAGIPQKKKRSKKVTLDLASLTPDQIALLREAGVLSE